MEVLTPTAYIVLGLLSRMDEASPYDLKQQVAMSVGSFWSVPHSQLYRAAEQLHESGHLDLRTEATEGGRPRKAYSLTAKGRSALERWLDEPAERMPELRDPGLLKLFFGAAPKRLGAERAAAHRQELEGYEALRSQDDGTGPRGPWLALDSGIGHAREWVRFWEALAES